MTDGNPREPVRAPADSDGAGEDALTDTDVLLRQLQPASTNHAAALRALFALHREGGRLWVAPQSLYEVWVVATRPVSANGLGLEASDAQALLAEIRSAYSVLPEAPLYERWAELVVRHRVMGKPAHDARLVAAMLESGIGRLLTFNAAHFRRYESEGIRLYDPRDF